MNISRSLLLILILWLFSVKISWAQFKIDKASLPLWAQPRGQSLLSEERYAKWLVEAESVDVDNSNPRFPHSIVQITHNYTGPEEVIGQRFIPSGPFYTGVPPFPLMQRGSKGIFVIRWYQSRGHPDKTGFGDGSSGYDYNFPALEKFEPNKFGREFPPYPEALAYAQSIERVAKADRNEQIRLLGSYAKSEMPQRSAWAISTLAQSGLESAPKFLLGLLNEPKLPLAGTLALDEGLQALDENGKAQWSRTSTRFDLWRHLVTAPAKEDDGIFIIRRIVDLGREQSRKRQSAQTNKKTYAPDIGGARLFEWLRLAAKNPKWTRESRAFALGSVGTLSRDELISRAAAWNYLLSQTKTHPDFAAPTAKPLAAQDKANQARFAEVALGGLFALRPFTTAETATLRALQKRAQAPELKRIFGELFEPKR